jgi:hypothetical protein
VNIGGTRGKVFYDVNNSCHEYFIVANDKVYVGDRKGSMTAGSNTSYMRLVELKQGGEIETTSFGCKKHLK